MDQKHSFTKYLQDAKSQTINRGRDAYNSFQDQLNNLELSKDEYLTIGLGLGGGLAAPIMASAIDSNQGDQTGFGEGVGNFFTGLGTTTLGAGIGAGAGAGYGQINPTFEDDGKYDRRPSRRAGAIGGAAMGAAIGGIMSGARMINNDRNNPPAPGAQESIAASLSMKDRSEITALLDAHGAL